MTINCKAFTVTITTGAVGTTFDVTGLTGFHLSSQVAVSFFWNGRATTGFGEQSSKLGGGFFTGTASRRAHTSAAFNALGTSSTFGAWFNDCCIATTAGGGVLDGKADIDSIITDGFRLRIDDQFGAAIVVGGIARWGDGFEASITDFNPPATATTQNINVGQALNTGVNDKGLIILGSSNVAAGTITVQNGLSVGLVAGDTIAQAVLFGCSRDSVPDSETDSYCLSGECTAARVLLTDRAAVTAWLSTGFTFTWAEVTGTSLRNFSVLSMKGGRYAVGDILSQTGTSDTDETVGFAPHGILAISHCKTASTSDTVQAHDERSVGAATSATERWVAFIADQDAVPTTDIGVGFQDDAFYGRIDVTNATKAVIGLGDLVSFGADKFTFKMDDADPDQAFIAYMAMGDVPAAGARPSLIGGKLTSSLLLGGLVR